MLPVPALSALRPEPAPDDGGRRVVRADQLPWGGGLHAFFAGGVVGELERETTAVWYDIFVAAVGSLGVIDTLPSRAAEVEVEAVVCLSANLVRVQPVSTILGKSVSVSRLLRVDRSCLVFASAATRPRKSQSGPREISHPLPLGNPRCSPPDGRNLSRELWPLTFHSSRFNRRGSVGARAARARALACGARCSSASFSDQYKSRVQPGGGELPVSIVKSRPLIHMPAAMARRNPMNHMRRGALTFGPNSGNVGPHLVRSRPNLAISAKFGSNQPSLPARWRSKVCPALHRFWSNLDDVGQIRAELGQIRQMSTNSEPMSAECYRIWADFKLGLGAAKSWPCWTWGAEGYLDRKDYCAR